MTKNIKHRVFYAIVALALVVIGYYSFLPQREIARVNNQPQVSSKADTGSQSGIKPTDNQKVPPGNNNSGTAIQQTVKTSSANTGPVQTAINVIKSEVSSTAKFYPYVLDGTKMEIIAVKATDGTIRTALNTCQVCYDSGRGYYVQEGEYLVCQNCGNRFHINQIEKIKGGCNPVPILETDKKDLGDHIILSTDFIATQKQYFKNWKLV